MKPKLSKIEVNRLLRRKASLERKLIFVREHYYWDYTFIMKVTNIEGEKIEVPFNRSPKNQLRRTMIRSLKIELKWVNSDLGIYTNFKDL